MPHETHHAGYLLSDDPALLDVDAVHAYLTHCYWAAGISRDIVARSLENSLSLGLYAPAVQPATAAAHPGAQVGLVRVITDSATFAYLCDVYVLEAHRGHGLAKAALRHLATHPRLQNLRRQHLVTQDAHGLYSQFGFVPLAAPGRHMEKCDSNLYRRGILPR